MLQIWRNPKLPTLTVLGLVVLVAVQASFSQAGRQQVLHVDSRIGDEGYTITPFSWKNIAPSKSLTWQQCYSRYQCARLIVPLDYQAGFDSQNVATIAIIRKPSQFSSGSPEYGGPILFNPGGPGGSGVELILEIGESLAPMLGPQYDLVGFDPRGVGRSTPRGEAFSSPAERALWYSNVEPLDIRDEFAHHAWARAQILGKKAEFVSGDFLQHINTQNTARDMLQIVEAFGAEKLQYWGFSYGTVLGATFASLFPDKVGRMVLDGVVNAEDYYSGTWAGNLRDTNITMQEFYRGCSAAGPDGCPFYAPVPDMIEQNLHELLEAVRKNPVPIVTPQGDYGILDYPKMRVVIFRVLYQPHKWFYNLAWALQELKKGNGLPLYEIYAGGQGRFECDCNAGGGGGGGDDWRMGGSLFDNGEEERDAGVFESLHFVACTDGSPLPNTVEGIKALRAGIKKWSSEWGGIWANFPIACTGWPRFKRKHFQGPFSANTSSPILFVGNTADPVTPLWGAHKMAKGYPGSVVLTQDSPGHCSLAAPSSCTTKYIRDYFANGTLPPKDAVCKVDGTPWLSSLIDPELAASNDSGSGDDEDENFRLSTERLTRGFRAPFPL